MEATETFCKKMGWTYQIVTEKKIRCTRLNIIKDLITSAKHYSLINFKKDLGRFSAHLKQTLTDSPKKFSDLAQLLNAFLQHLEIEEIISLVKYKIYYLGVSIDWNKPLENTMVFLNGVNPQPVYDLPLVEEYESDYEPIIIPKTKSKPKKPSDKDKQKYKERLALVTPVINELGKDGKYSDIIAFCKEENLPPEKTYKLYLKWKREKKAGFWPARADKHRKSHLDQRVEELLQNAISKWDTEAGQNYMEAYTEFCETCYKSNLKPASYTIFRKRIKALPAVEQVGKFKPSRQSNIRRGLSGTYREGRHPGCVIQMDHTLLNIWLVDSYTKQPYGKPWITLGIDPFSRSIWTFYISFDTPSQETVTRAILNGLIPKDQLKEWQILKRKLQEKGNNPDDYKLTSAGFPARIQVDNGRDFRANLVTDFLMESNITLEFRPIKTPEYGGFVESPWKTIKGAIINKLLTGRAFPRPKTHKAVSRVQYKAPPGYDPKKNAGITIDQLREWLFELLVINYSTTPKAKQNFSPNEKWTRGLKGERSLPMGGALRLLTASEYKKLDFLSKIPHASQLSERGLRYKNIYYTSKWLREGRKKRILKDGQSYEFRVSKWDIRIIQMVNPENGGIETLEAYNYDGDDAIKEYILNGLGKTPGILPFRISLNDIKEAKKSIGVSDYSGKEQVLIMGELTEDLRKKVKITKKEQKHLQKLTETKEGRTLVQQAKALAQLDEEIPSGTTNIGDLIMPEKEDVFADLDELEEYPTDWSEAKKKMRIVFDNEDENED